MTQNLIFLEVASASRFKEDLGLDSLDAVEVVMAIEEVGRFSFRAYYLTH